jgi:ribosome-associated heat shock protein Hsp15
MRNDMTDADAAASVRLDIWLDVACLFKTRSEAQKACRGGKVDVNGQTAKPNRLLRPGDEIQIGRPFGRKQRIVVRGIADRHVAKSEARLLYEDLTPAPTLEEIETRRLERAYRAAMTPPRAPDKRQRRALRKLKGRE